ncbi:MAG: RecX family transcriptional regulator [Phycisphaerae bacterium]|jgi:SOS response regulatory protein OraA/RecX|nr:RecX family transcriptional regulator [Phycisphaerae bacterium]
MAKRKAPRSTAASSSRQAVGSTRSTGLLTALVTRDRDPSLVEVHVDGIRVGIVLRSAIDDLGLREGARLSAAKRVALATACERAEARTLALRLLAGRDRSGAMLERHLVEGRGISQPVAIATRKQLQSDGWQDDRRYAETRAATLVAERHASHALVLETLIHEGIADRLAREVATAIASPSTELARAIACARSTMSPAAQRGAGGAAAKRTLARKIAQQLARRGYEEETVWQALERIGLRAEE